MITRRGLFGLAAAAIARRRAPALVPSRPGSGYLPSTTNWSMQMYAFTIPVSAETMAWLKKGARRL